MSFERAPAPHLPARNSVSRVMGLVCIALVPAAAVHVFLFGPGLLINALLAVATALACEGAVLRLRGRDAAAALRDNSALVLALLLAFALPPLCPWWVTVTATAFATVVAKQLYGGLGFNTFNPAMAGYAAALVSFPEAMTRWPVTTLAPDGYAAPGWGQSLAAILTGRPPAGMDWDAMTMATPLDQVQVELGMRRMISEVMAPENLVGEAGWIALQLAIVAGGLALLYLRVIRWHIPVAVLAGTLVCATVLRLVDADAYLSPWFHLTHGATLLGAFFIATDPVSAAASRRGRLVYGAGIGVLLVLIRSYGAYPDSLAFAVLLMNCAVPLIDHYTVPRAYGHAPPREESL